MKKTIIFILACLISNVPEEILSQESNSISGRIIMPSLKKESRTFRGRIYRNRLSSVSKAGQRNEVLKTNFIDVIVSAHPLSFTPGIEPLQDVKVLQLNAEFIPRVIPITPGTEVQFVNRDHFFHNVFSITPGARFNIGRRPTGYVVIRKIDTLGEVKIFCDIHAQMNATIISLDTPYFTRGEPNGTYKLDGLPEGRYEVRVYHPELPRMVETVELKAGISQELNFNLTE